MGIDLDAPRGSEGSLGELAKDLDAAGGNGLDGVDDGEDGGAEILDGEDEGAGHEGAALEPDEVDHGGDPVGANGEGVFAVDELVAGELAHALGGELLEEAADGLEGDLGDGVGAVEHVGGDAGPPGGDAVEEVDVVLAEGDEVVAGEDAAEGFGGGEAEVVAGGVEAVRDLLVAVADELGQAVRGDGGQDGHGGGGHVWVREVEVVADAAADRLPEVRRQPRGADEVEGQLLADGGRGGRHDLLHGGLRDHGGVAARRRLLERLEEGPGLAEGVVGAEVGLDLGEEDVHCLVIWEMCE